MKKKKQIHREHKSHFAWAVTGILVVLFIMFFVNGYLIHTQTGIDDQDVSVLGDN